jgi:isoamylase
MNPWQASEGNPYPLCVTWIEEEQAFNFGVFSEYGIVVELLLFAQDEYIVPVRSLEFPPILNRSGRTWHIRISKNNIGNALYYAYRVDGPSASKAGQYYDADKLLLDPYASGVAT